MDVLWLAVRQFTGIHNRIPQNLSDLCKLLVMCTIVMLEFAMRCCVCTVKNVPLFRRMWLAS